MYFTNEVVQNTFAFKPFPGPDFKPKRLPQRKALTIIAGFRCSEGIVLCADTQETSGSSKKDVPKLRFSERGILTDTPLAVAFCGAGPGPFIDRMIDQAWEDVQVATTLDEACDEIKRSIEETYKRYGSIFQDGQCPTADLIYGVKASGGSRLFCANGPIVNEKDYYSSGAGYYMADFLAKRMYSKNLNLRQCAILAAFIIFQAKEHVDGCGGATHIGVLRDEGVSGLAEAENIKAITEMADSADISFGRMLLQAADLDLSSDEFMKPAAEEIEYLDRLREAQKNNLQKSGLWNLRRVLGSMGTTPDSDFLGLPIPPPQKAKE
jgi:20S proteasome alpha/beta subunit